MVEKGRWDFILTEFRSKLTFELGSDVSKDSNVACAMTSIEPFQRARATGYDRLECKQEMMERIEPNLQWFSKREYVEGKQNEIVKVDCYK